MAEQQQSENGGRNFSAVVSLLRQAESLLSSSDQIDRNRNSSPSPSANTDNSANSTDRSIANFRSLFARYSGPTSGNRSSLPVASLGQARASSAPPTKRKKTGFPFVVKETWTHDFFCLADCADHQQPTRAEKCQLQEAGLGRKKVIFNRKDNPLAFVEKLESVFPKLKGAGGFEILRSGPTNKDLVLVNPPPTGYSVPFLKEASGLGQALAYIRPLQRSLTLEASQPLFKDLPGASSQCPRVECITCKLQLPVTGVREHQLVCPSSEHVTPPASEASVMEQGNEKSGEESWVTGNCYSVVQDQCASSRSMTSADRESSAAVLRELCPDATSEQISQSLNNSNGDVNLAAQELLGLSQEASDLAMGCEAQDSEDDLLTPTFLSQSTPEKMTALTCMLTPEEALEAFQKTNIQKDKPRERFFVSRLEGNEELKKDILGLYKDPEKNLRASIRVRFEGEEGVGTGPVREFFVCAMTILQEGIHGDGRPILFFEGESDHLLPIHNQILQQMGAFISIGKIIGHSILHGGPGIYGFSPVAKHYWSHDDLGTDPPPIIHEDLPDLNLRETIQEFQQWNTEEKVSDELRTSLSPYMMEAGLEPELLCGGRDVLVQGLLWYFVIDKRKREFDDIAKGMNEVSLQTFLTQQPTLLEIVFPPHAAKQITTSEFLAKVTYDNERRERDNQARAMFEQYVQEIAQRKEGGIRLNDLCSFWTGWDFLPPRRAVLVVKFHNDEISKLPTSETCFMSLMLPVGHNTYEDFRNGMDTAIQYGCRGFAFA